ncbi:ATP synthase F1 subunit epsilon [Candidatus Roizmanbacteria bacterium]|nr:ATP synthase F1 subunit epsilon [Candidatus Roizmanbacteria bacterium]
MPNNLHLKIITPRKVVLEDEVTAVTAPAAAGEITVLPRHTSLFALLKEGIVKIKYVGREDFLAIGGGYLETDGKVLNVLVSRAYHQSEIDERQTEEAIKNAKKILLESKDEKTRADALTLLRRSTIDLKLIKRHKYRG